MDRIVLFDGVCNFCNGAVNFIIRHDDKKKFRFAPLQSAFGEQMRMKFGIGDDVDSIILIEGAKAYLHSTAGLKIAKELGLPWSLGYAAFILPEAFRDGCYKLFAKYRYKLFGRKDLCMMPTPDLRERFIDDAAATVADAHA
jgi:predicted DCC family thiol-disulfide oxidoreductase YuxK